MLGRHVGSGTGIFARGLLDRGAVVFAVEPNREMRECAETALGFMPSFHGVIGRSEATTLDTASMDAVTAAQAFHWFDTTSTRIEFSRVLKPNGQVCIAYNERDVCDPFSPRVRRAGWRLYRPRQADEGEIEGPTSLFRRQVQGGELPEQTGAGSRWIAGAGSFQLPHAEEGRSRV